MRNAVLEKPVRGGSKWLLNCEIKKTRPILLTPYIYHINAKPNNSTGRETPDAARSLESAADYARGGTPTTPDHYATERERRDRIEKEQQRLVQWAKTNGKLGGNLPPEDASGGEHRVCFDEKSQRFLKATILEKQKGYGLALGALTHGATPAEYLDRLALQNYFFDDDIRLEYVVLISGRPVIITSQPAIAGQAAPRYLVDELMVSAGYERLAAGAFYREGFLVFDLAPRNAILAADGIVYPIDPVVQRIQPDFADFLRKNPNRINGNSPIAH